MLPPISKLLADNAAVAALVVKRIYRHGEAVQTTAAPYVVWSVISGAPENTLSELPAIDAMIVQVDCWHPTDAGVEMLASAVRAALEPHAHCTGVPVNAKDPETRLYRIALQFDYWLGRSA